MYLPQIKPNHHRTTILAAILAGLFITPCYAQAGGQGLAVKTTPFGWVTQYKDPQGNTHRLTGGEGATEESIYVVSNRQELKDALNNINSSLYIAGDSDAELKAKLAPKIIYWQGTIHGDELTDGRYADVDYYKSNPNRTQFDFDLYVKAFDQDYRAQLQATIDAGGNDAAAAKTELDLLRKQNGQRAQYANNQKKQIQFQVPPNTTILGVGSEAKLVKGYLSLNTMSQTFDQTENSNIIIRNVTFEAPRDFAPAWDGSDGASGNWNARYDAISINASNHIWIDHCSFSDGEHFDKDEPIIFGKHIQRHDGLLDIEDDSDYITLSYNVFSNHDKTMIIGSGDSDAGDYRLTFEGNLWQNSTQRAPRVRFGKVHLLNNYHQGATDADYPISYAIGMGYQSSILSESNVFDFQGSGATENMIIATDKGSQFKDVGSWFNGNPAEDLNQIAMDKCAALQTKEKDQAAQNNRAPASWAFETCTNQLDWTPPYDYTVGHSASAVEAYVVNNAGAGKLTIALPQE